MDEQTWLTKNRLAPMLSFLQRIQLSKRKASLVAVGFVGRLSDTLGDAASGCAIESLEAFVDGNVSVEELRVAAAALDHSPSVYAVELIIRFASTYAPNFDWRHFAWAVAARLGEGNRAKNRAVQVQVLRDIFGNPFRPVAFDADWRTSTAVALAKQMYESRDFSAIPILADALQDAGCDIDNVLTHCRNTNGAHVRGCWVVDLVLGKS
jgi:hypothetical protein